MLNEAAARLDKETGTQWREKLFSTCHHPYVSTPQQLQIYCFSIWISSVA